MGGKKRGREGDFLLYILIERMLELHSSNTWRIILFPSVCIGLGLVHCLDVKYFFFSKLILLKQRKGKIEFLELYVAHLLFR